MKKRKSVPVAVGNHRTGYRGLMRVVDPDGKERQALGPCDHRHETTAAARTCAVLRFQ